MNRHVKNPRRRYTPPPLAREPGETKREHRVEIAAFTAVFALIVALLIVLVWAVAHLGNPA